MGYRHNARKILVHKILVHSGDVASEAVVWARGVRTNKMPSTPREAKSAMDLGGKKNTRYTKDEPFTLLPAICVKCCVIEQKTHQAVHARYF